MGSDEDAPGQMGLLYEVRHAGNTESLAVMLTLYCQFETKPSGAHL